jgi:hypothetical protein
MTRFMAVAAAVVAIAFPGCEAETDGEDVLNALVAFARQPSDETWASVPFADRVKLGLGDRLLRTRSAQELRDPAVWKLDVDLFRGGVGPFSSLDVLASHEGPLEHREGRYRRCASPPARRRAGSRVCAGSASSPARRRVAFDGSPWTCSSTRAETFGRSRSTTGSREPGSSGTSIADSPARGALA